MCIKTRLTNNLIFYVLLICIVNRISQYYQKMFTFLTFLSLLATESKEENTVHVNLQACKFAVYITYVSV
jgi:hypothetical protein